MHTLPLLHRWGGIQPEVQMEVWRCHGISRLARWLGSAAKQSKGTENGAFDGEGSGHQFLRSAAIW